MEAIRYEDSQIDPRIIRAVTEMGYEEMTPIQQMAVPAMLEGKDIIGQAQTGTGKTAAFGIPMIQMMDDQNENVQGIILCPTRELAIQAAEELRHFAKYMQGIKVLPVYGGQDIEKQIRSLRSKVTIVVGTPGRVLDHMRRHTLRLDSVKMVILDEADEMLNMGFRDSIEDVLKGVPENHQTALFSATMPKAILDITCEYQKDDAVKIEVERKELTIPLVKQYYYEVKRPNKEEVVARLLDYYNPKRSLIFCNTKRMVDELTENLKGRGYFAEGLHGDLSQAQRDKVMKGFRTGTVEILIATDVAARGIDVDDVEAVFNYDIPQDNEYYVHRIGRTGRAGRKGRSFTIVVGREIYRIRDIERMCNTKIEARMVPTAADINAAKSQKVFKQVMDIIADNDLTELTMMVQDKVNDEDVTAMELCAAFLKLHLGEEKEDIPEESYFKERDKRRKQGGNFERQGERRRDGRGDSERRYRDLGDYRNHRDNDRNGDYKKRRDGEKDGDFIKKRKDFDRDSDVKKRKEFGKGDDSKKRKDFGRDGDFKKRRDFDGENDSKKRKDFDFDGALKKKKDSGKDAGFKRHKDSGKKDDSSRKKDSKDFDIKKEMKSKKIRELDTRTGMPKGWQE